MSLEGPEQPKKMSRRDFLRKASMVGYGAATVANATQVVGLRQKGVEQKADLEARRKSVTTLETADAVYKIEYTEHDLVSTPETVEGAHALILEYGGLIYEPHFVKTAVETGFPGEIVNTEAVRRPYMEVLKAAIDNDVPIFIVDVAQGHEDQDQALETDMVLKKAAGFVEQIGGFTLLPYVARSNGNSAELSRREFLGRAAAGVAASYLLTPFVENASAFMAGERLHHLPDEGSTARAIEKQAAVLNEKIHPEFNSQMKQGRSMLIAEKTAAVAAAIASEIGRKPTVAIEIGSGHTTLEHDLAMDYQDRLEQLKKYFGSQRLAEETKIARITPSHEGGESYIKIDILSDPNMAAE